MFRLQSFITIGLFAYRFALTEEILETFVKTYGNGYIKLQ